VWRRARESKAIGNTISPLTQHQVAVLPFVKEVILFFVFVHAEVSRIMGSLSEQILPTVLGRMTTAAATGVMHYVRRMLAGSQLSRPVRLCLYNSLVFLNSSIRIYQTSGANSILQTVLTSLEVLPLHGRCTTAV
jgi:Exocyst complex component Sec5